MVVKVVIVVAVVSAVTMWLCNCVNAVVGLLLVVVWRGAVSDGMYKIERLVI